MKKLFYTLIIICAAIAGANAQTLTPTGGASTQSLQSVEINTLLAMSKTLTNIYNLLNAGSTNTLSITSSVVTSATVPAGAYKVGFLTSSAFTGSVNGTSFDPSLYLQFGDLPNHYLPAITCTATTGSVTIIVTK